MFSRIISLIGPEKFQKIQNSRILVLGVGGVGGYVVEGLVRSGVQNITIVDYDTIDISNINRQLIATNTNIGRKKVDVWKERIRAINPSVKVKTIADKIDENNIETLFNEQYDYLVDACDTIAVKKLLIKMCKERNINLLTVCGMGKKLDPSQIKICDIRDTSYDPLAKALRKYVKDEKIKGKVPCVFSPEKIPITNNKIVSSMMMVPASSGVLAVSYIINSIIDYKTK